jgi:cardiolipin synthase A/B
MLAAIGAARQSIHLEVYAFSADGIGARFIEALAQAGRRGVSVKIVIDGWGSARSGRTVAAALRDARCEVLVYNRLRAILVGRIGRNHRKILLVDDHVAFLGGINIDDAFLSDSTRTGWADLALEIRGPACVRLGQELRHQPRQPVDQALRIYLSGIGGGWRLRRRYVKAFERARARIQIAHGYFLPDRKLVRSITAAARRGVQVNLLLAGTSDVLFARLATRSLHRRLLAAGVHIREWSSSILHAKVATVDGKLLLIGSFNLDPFSLSMLEALVEVTDVPVVAKADAWIDDRFAAAHPLSALEGPTRWRRWLVDRLGLVLARMAGAFGRLLGGR